VEVVWEEEPGSAGKIFTSMLQRALPGWNAHSFKATGSKLLRTTPFFRQAQAGAVYLLRSPFVNTWLDEVAMFPVGSHDDQIDSAALAFNALATSYTFGVRFA